MLRRNSSEIADGRGNVHVHLQIRDVYTSNSSRERKVTNGIENTSYAAVYLPIRQKFRLLTVLATQSLKRVFRVHEFINK